MKPKSKKKKQVIPSPQERIVDPRFHNLIVIAIFAILTLILFRESFFNPSLMLYGTDVMSSGVFFRSFYANFWKTYHTMPLWEPYIHGGMPFVDGMHGDIFYPTTVLKFFFPVTYAMSLKLILHVFLAGVFMFYFLRGLNLRVGVSFLGGLLYMFSPCLVSLVYPGHDGKIFVMALTPLAFLILHKACKSGRLFHFLLFSLALALLILSAHMQMAYFACWGLGLFFLFQLWNIYRKGNRKIGKYIAYFVISIILGLSISMVQLLSPYFYLKTHSMRTMHTEDRGGYEYATSWSMNLEEATSEIVPEFSGDNIHTQGNFYWGRNPFKLNSEYIGLLALFLAVVTIIYRRSRLTWFFLGLGGLAFIYALGATTPFFRIFYHLVPGVKNFRAVGMINFLFCFSTVTIAMLGLEKFFTLKDHPDEAKGFLKIAFIFVIAYSGLAILVSLLGKSFFDLWIAILYGGIEPAKRAALMHNIPRIIGGLWISTALLWLGYGVLRLHLKGALKEGLVVGALAVVALVDLFRFDSRFIVVVDPSQYYRKSPVVDFLQERQKEEPFRVFILPKSYPDNYLALYGIEEVSLSAMHGNHLRIYDEFVGRHEQNPNLTHPNFMNLLNVKYLLSPSPLNTPWTKQVFETEGIYVYQNLGYLPRAFPVYSWEVEKDERKILSELKNLQFDIRQKMFLAEALPNIPSDSTKISSNFIIPAKVYDYKINSFEVDVEMQQDGFLFLSENYYPAWKAYVDGKETKIYRADYLFRAVYLEQGRHQVKFVFESAPYKTGKTSTLLTSLALLLIFGFYLIKGRVSKKVIPNPKSRR
ncbi:MAG: YfhO family protein [candidate division Zixibacteria bacterium]|nr:YfhO family protein [candidate division Zixibacteria bacterium]